MRQDVLRPTPVIGGISMMLFGVIAATGLRMLIEAKVDYSKSRNLLRVAVVFVVGISGGSSNSATPSSRAWSSLPSWAWS